ncbi:MAG: DUF4159 domain-containing protein [Flavobacteriales bacterium]|nr:DUF4159 domain-containing protein [Flavobacteriales bacterium]
MRKLFFLIIFLPLIGLAQNGSYQIAILKYGGGGDWYSNLETSLPNLIEFTNKNLKTNIKKEQAIVEASSSELFDYPFLHMTGHGNVVFTNEEAENLNTYLMAGGFLHIDDNYGMDQFVRREIKKVFPNEELIEVPFNHPIYHQKYDFNNGLPKIHEHDGKTPLGLGIIKEGRLVLFYSTESDLGDGWEDPAIHNDSEVTRVKALQMGSNILSFIFLGE